MNNLLLLGLGFQWVYYTINVYAKLSKYVICYNNYMNDIYQLNEQDLFTKFDGPLALTALENYIKNGIDYSVKLNRNRL